LFVDNLWNEFLFDTFYAICSVGDVFDYYCYQMQPKLTHPTTKFSVRDGLEKLDRKVVGEK
jgi:hypothetical protein